LHWMGFHEILHWTDFYEILHWTDFHELLHWTEFREILHWTDFHEILYFNIFRKSVEKIQVLFKTDKNNGYFTRRLIYIYDSTLSFLLKITNISNKISIIKSKHILCSITFFLILSFMR
jgi:hypothetical protein